jgi:hypothetical protein
MLRFDAERLLEHGGLGVHGFKRLWQVRIVLKGVLVSTTFTCYPMSCELTLPSASKRSTLTYFIGLSATHRNPIVEHRSNPGLNSKNLA